MNHFIQDTDFSYDQIENIFQLASTLKRDRLLSSLKPLSRESWGILFFKKSTRTRVSFEVGIYELGGHPLLLNASDLQLSRGESMADTARILSGYLHGIIIRTHEHASLEAFAACASIPVINALTDSYHPCQSYTDYFTLAEYLFQKNPYSGKKTFVDILRDRKIAFLGDTACNMARSLTALAKHLGVEIVLSGPEAFAPSERECYNPDPFEAVRGADVVYTDVWISMGDESEEKERLQSMQPYAVTEKILSAAKPDAVFMHCLPAHPGQEVTSNVLYGPQSIVFQQAENRLHVQKAILTEIVNLNG